MTYSKAYHHYHLDTPTQYTPPSWANAFICQDRGLVHVSTYAGEFNGEVLMQHVKKVHKAMGEKPWALLLDGAGPHKSGWVGDQLRELGVTRVFSPPYSPEYNPAEACFSIVKAWFKAQRLNVAINSKGLLLQKLMLDSFKQLNVDKVNACIRHANRALFSQDSIPRPEEPTSELGFHPG